MKNSCVVNLLFLAIFSGCGNQDILIQSPERLADMQRMLAIQQDLTSGSLVPPWDIFNARLTADERQALEFLYAYMPLSDLADYPPAFFLASIKQSLKARREMTWGSSIPEEVFLHYVLPLRVNNEKLDSFRITMYEEITDRINGMTMNDAALEINHWCHEKVNYRSTDIRTSAPLSTMKKTFGRCGEESTFTVSALRTAGIPARQVYTPRWAHTDDNHAWVEVWIEGKWHYLGACEPEPELDQGWFSEPSRRAMLVHTRTYGRYFGNEEAVITAGRFSELNLTARYATVKTITVAAKLADGSPADSARVEFKLYNYAEYFPIAVKYTDAQGIAQLTTGMGDLLIWASREGAFNYEKLSVPETDTLVLVLNRKAMYPHEVIFDMVPPHAMHVENIITAEQRRENDRLLAREDSIRNAYMSTFKDSTWAASLAIRLNLDRDSVQGYILKSYGNWPEMALFFERNHKDHRGSVLALAGQLSDKDLSDAKETMLTDHLKETPVSNSLQRDDFIRYVLSPRIDAEHLSPWRGFLRKNMGHLEEQAHNDISTLIEWINEHIRIDEQANLPSRAPITPIGVYNLRLADPLSRDIFFVAVCRTLGIPSRLNPVTRSPEYLANNTWQRADFNNKTKRQALQGFLTLINSGNVVIPQYYVHFTIGVLQDGHYVTLEYEEGKDLTDFQNVMLDTGQYVLITGNRMEDGPVLSSMSFFKIRPGVNTSLQVKLRQNTRALKPSGKLALDRLFIKTRPDDPPVSLGSLTQGKNLVIMLLDPGPEPSKHVLNDLGSYVDHYNRLNSRFIFITSPGKNLHKQYLDGYKLPADRITGIDAGDNILKTSEAQFGNGLQGKLPLVICCDSTGNVYLFSSGYRIGIGEQILKLMR